MHACKFIEFLTAHEQVPRCGERTIPPPDTLTSPVTQEFGAMQSRFLLAPAIVLCTAWLTTAASAQPGKQHPGAPAAAAPPAVAHPPAPVPHVAPAPVPRPTPAPVPHAAPQMPHVSPQVAGPRGPPHVAQPNASSVPRPMRHNERSANVPAPAQPAAPSARTAPAFNQRFAAPHEQRKEQMAAPQGQGNLGGRNVPPSAPSSATREMRPPNPEANASKSQVHPLNSRPGTNVSGRVLRNPVLGNRAVNANPQLRAIAQSTFHGRFAARFGDLSRQRFIGAPSVIGFIGPVFWPFASADFVDYSFYAYGYDAFWPYAYDDFYQSVFGNFAYGIGSAYAAAQPQARGARNVEICTSEPTALTQWPVTAIAQAVGPNDAQRNALDELRNSALKAVSVLKSACPSDLPSTPTGRIAAMRLRLATMLEAARIVRPALAGFYEILDDEQKARFNALGYGGEQDTAEAGRDLAQVCDERAAGIADLPMERIEQAVHPQEQQGAALNELRNATAQAVDLLRSNCPTYRPLTPVARLEAMEQRLALMLRAVDVVQPALTVFYRSLGDEQKEAFNRLSANVG